MLLTTRIIHIPSQTVLGRYHLRREYTPLKGLGDDKFSGLQESFDELQEDIVGELNLINKKESTVIITEDQVYIPSGLLRDCVFDSDSEYGEADAWAELDDVE